MKLLALLLACLPLVSCQVLLPLPPLEEPAPKGPVEPAPEPPPAPSQPAVPVLTIDNDEDPALVLGNDDPALTIDR